MTTEHRQAVTPRLPSMSRGRLWGIDPLCAAVWIGGPIAAVLIVVGAVTVWRWVF